MKQDQEEKTYMPFIFLKQRHMIKVKLALLPEL